MDATIEISKDASGDVTSVVLSMAKADLIRLANEGTGPWVEVRFDGLKPLKPEQIVDPYAWVATMRDGRVLRRGARLGLGSPPILSPIHLPADRVEVLSLEPAVEGWPAASVELDFAETLLYHRVREQDVSPDCACVGRGRYVAVRLAAALNGEPVTGKSFWLFPDGRVVKSVESFEAVVRQDPEADAKVRASLRAAGG